MRIFCVNEKGFSSVAIALHDENRSAKLSVAIHHASRNIKHSESNTALKSIKSHTAKLSLLPQGNLSVITNFLPLTNSNLAVN